jgi:hypothetical protein
MNERKCDYLREQRLRGREEEKEEGKKKRQEDDE